MSEADGLPTGKNIKKECDMVKINFDAIPQELKDRPQWVNRGIDTSTGEPNKVPIDPKTGAAAKANDPSSWGSYDQAVARYNQGSVSGIGFEFSSDDPYFGIDLDHCVDADGNISPDAMKIINDFGSYAEFSTSKTGIHIFCLGILPPGGRKKGGIEVYDQGRYFIVTGDVIPPFFAIRHCQEQIDGLHTDVFGSLIDEEASCPDTRSSNEEAIESSLDEEEIIRLASGAKNSSLFRQLFFFGNWQGRSGEKAYSSHSEADLALLSMLAFYTGKNAQLMKSIFTKSQLYRTKCDARHSADGRTYLEMSIETAIKGCKDIYNPNYHCDENGERSSSLALFNKQYAVAMLGNRCVIIDETNDDVEFLKVNDFKLFNQTQKFKIKDAQGNEKKGSVVDQWLKWEGRRQYKRVIFRPGIIDYENFNMWRGFAVTPRYGDWSLMRYHIEQVICRGNEKYYRYVYAWIARIFQDPGGERPGVALILRGKPGTGKGVLARYVGKIFGKHFVHVFSPHQFAGRFNAHLKMCVLLFADEAFMTGNQEATGILKGMITEPYIMCEPKGVDPYRIENNVNVIAAGNASYLVPAGEAERRFCVLDVDDKHIQDSEYFRKICSQMDNGGVEAMFHDLLNLDISGVNLRDFPRSTALFDQQLRGMTSIQQWWYECLKYGVIASNSCGKILSDEWPERLTIAATFAEFCSYLVLINIRNTISPTLFGRDLRKVCPKLKRRRNIIDGDREYFYEFPPLEECRRLFCSLMNFEITWEDF